MSTLNDTDLFVIERSGTQYQVRSDEMSTLNDTDLFVVERDGDQYKIEAQYVSTGPTGALEAPVEVLTPLNGAGIGAGTPYNPISSPIVTVDGNNITCSDDTELANMVGPITMTDENGDLVTPQTSEIIGVNDSAANKTLTFADNTDLEYFQPGDAIGGSLNQSQDWSSGTVTGTPYQTNTWDKVFDNSTGTGVFTYATTSSTITLPGPVAWSSSFEVYGVKYGGTLLVNDTDVGSLLSLGEGWVDLTSVVGTSGTLTSLTVSDVSTNYTKIYSIKLDGKVLADPGIVDPDAVSVVSVDAANSQMVVDGGEWLAPNQSQVWSSQWSGTAFDGYPVTNMFDGNLVTQGVTAINNTQTWTIPGGLDFTNSLQVRAKGSGTAGSTLVANFADGTSTEIQSSSTNSDGSYTIFDLKTGNGKLNNVVINSGSSTSKVFFVTSWYVDGNILIDEGITVLGDTSVSLSTLEASATDVIGVDGNTLKIDGVSGTWKTGLRIKGASISSSAPSPNSVVFTSSNGGTTAVTGTDATLTSRVWTLEKSSAQTGPWTVVGEYTDLDANASQDGATPWSGKPDLEANTFYQVKVKYTSDNADPVESVFNTFKTGDA